MSGYDVVFDTVGVLHPRDADALLTPGGRLLLAAATLGETITARGRVLTGTAGSGRDLVSALVERVADGTLTPLIEASLPLDRIVEAHARWTPATRWARSWCAPSGLTPVPSPTPSRRAGATARRGAVAPTR